MKRKIKEGFKIICVFPKATKKNIKLRKEAQQKLINRLTYDLYERYCDFLKKYQINLELKIIKMQLKNIQMLKLSFLECVGHGFRSDPDAGPGRNVAPVFCPKRRRFASENRALERGRRLWHNPGPSRARRGTETLSTWLPRS